jgi:amphiphysin
MDLLSIEDEVLAPAKEFHQLVHSVKKLITKRDHKLVDFDRHRESQQKLEVKNRDVGDEKKLGQVETV